MEHRARRLDLTWRIKSALNQHRSLSLMNTASIPWSDRTSVLHFSNSWSNLWPRGRDGNPDGWRGRSWPLGLERQLATWLLFLLCVEVARFPRGEAGTLRPHQNTRQKVHDLVLKEAGKGGGGNGVRRMGGLSETSWRFRMKLDVFTTQRNIALALKCSEVGSCVLRRSGRWKPECSGPPWSASGLRLSSWRNRSCKHGGEKKN